MPDKKKKPARKKAASKRSREASPTIPIADAELVESDSTKLSGPQQAHHPLSKEFKPILHEDITKALPEWKCHQKWFADEIKFIEVSEDGSAELTLKWGHTECRCIVPASFIKNNNPDVGDFFMIDRHGNMSSMNGIVFMETHDFANRMGFKREELKDIRFRALQMCDANPRNDANARAACVRYEQFAYAAEAVLNAFDTYASLQIHIERLTNELDVLHEAIDALDDGETEKIMALGDQIRDKMRELQEYKRQII